MKPDPPRRLIVFSDIHGNLHALRAVLDAIDEQPGDQVFCLGDVIGYGAFPNECCEILRERNITTLAGNHDHAALGRTDISFFNEIARRAAIWTHHQLTPENAAWLGERPYTAVAGDCLMVHATPADPQRWGYVLTYDDARKAFAAFSNHICLIGHSHHPVVIENSGERLSVVDGESIELRKECRYVINVGSIGQPRDQNPRACFVTLDLEQGRLNYCRVSYDVEGAQQAILDAGLPEELAARLACGW